MAALSALATSLAWLAAGTYTIHQYWDDYISSKVGDGAVHTLLALVFVGAILALPVLALMFTLDLFVQSQHERQFADKYAVPDDSKPSTNSLAQTLAEQTTPMALMHLPDTRDRRDDNPVA